MREYSFTIDSKELQKGLSLDRSARNRAGLSELVNLRGDPIAGLTALKAGRLPDSFPAMDWPYPQLLQGTQNLFLCYSDSIYLVDDSDYTMVPLDTFNPSDPDFLAPITAGGAWHLADFQTTYALFNGSCVVYRTHKDGIVNSGGDQTYVQDSIVMASGCSFNGQLVTAGPPALFWPEEWQMTVNAMARRVDPQLSLDWTANANFVFYSQIGGGDLLWLLDPESAANGDVTGSGYGTDRPLWFDLFHRFDNGFLPLPTRGTVLCVKPLERAVIVYTTNGVFALVPVILSDHIPTFGVKTVASNVCIAGRGAVTGSLFKHSFVTSDGELWSLLPDLTVKPALQSKYLKPLVASGLPVQLAYDDQEDEVYIGNGEEGFVKTSTGLSSVTRPPTTVENILGETIIVRSEVDKNGDDFLITTECYDMQVRGRKTLSCVEVAGFDVSDLEVQVLWANSPTDLFRESGWKRCSPEGGAFPLVTASDFKISIRGTAGVNARIDSVIVHWKLSDKRFVRGLYVSSADAGPS